MLCIELFFRGGASDFDIIFLFLTGGETEDEKVRVDIMENQAMDFRNGFVIMCYTDLVRAALKVK